MKRNSSTDSQSNFSKKISSLLIAAACLFIGITNAQQTYTFTNAAATGQNGPTQAQINTAYLATNLNGAVTVNSVGVQSWTVPQTQGYRITAIGAQGGVNWGLGASMAGDFTLTAGTVLRIVVGQMGGSNNNSHGSGGGGSFVAINNATVPLVVAGGGGGKGASVSVVQSHSHGTVVTSGQSPSSNAAPGGINGGGGGAGSSTTGGTQTTPGGNSAGSDWASGGGGFYTNGGNCNSGNTPGGRSFLVNNSVGGNASTTGAVSPGGFGGGGGSGDRGAGAGGYSGGGAGTNNSDGGGGGGSFNGGVNQANASGVNSGHGRVIIQELCFISLTANSGTLNPAICAGNSVTLATNATSYTWSTGNTTTNSIVVSPTSTQIYSVIGTSSLNCTSSNVMTVSVNAAIPSLSIANTASASGGICPNATITLTGSGATSYSWTGGVTNGVAFGPTSPSTYIVTGANACGTSTAAVTISVHPLPSVSAVVSQPTVCSGIPSNLTGVGNATAYAWSGGVQNGQNFFPTTTSNYTVIGTSALGCTNSAVASVTVVTTPVAPALPNPPLICIGNSATITSQGATTYSWITPAGVQSGSMIVVSPNTTTTYTLTKSNSNCVNTQTVQVIVNNLPPVSAFAQPTIICASTTASLFGAGALTYTWNAGGTPAFTLSGASPIVSPSVTTIYTLTASDGTCVNTTTVQIATNPNPTIQIVPTNTNICRGDQISLTANGALGYSWTTVGITSNTNAATITETPTSNIVYIVTGTNNFNCTTTSQQVVVVRPTPTLQIGTTKPLVCTGAPSSMTVSSQPGAGVSPCTYVWSANASAATTSVVTVNPITSTSYTAVGLAPNGCTSTVNYPISVFLPTFAVNSPTQSCQGGTVILTGTGANTYTWNGNQPFQSIPVSPAGPTVYFVAATSNSNGVNCVSTQSVQVTIYNNPTVTAVATRTQVCKTESTTIAGGGATTYTLNTGDAGTLIAVYPVGNATTYTLTGTDQNGCIGTATIQIKTSICFGIDEQNRFAALNVYPNPNNGDFMITASSEIELHVVNTIGQVVAVVKLTEANAHQVKLTDLSSGIYFLTGNNGTEQVLEKIVVDK